MDEAARPATVADLPELVRLATAMREEIREHRGGADRLLELMAEPLDGSLRERLVAPGACTLLGTYGEAAVGYASAVTTLRRDGSKVAVVDELFVEADARSVGVAEAMLSALVEWAAGSGCVAIDAVVLPGLREGKNLFERFGMAARALVVHRDLR